MVSGRAGIGPHGDRDPEEVGPSNRVDVDVPALGQASTEVIGDLPHDAIVREHRGGGAARRDQEHAPFRHLPEHVVVGVRAVLDAPGAGFDRPSDALPGVGVRRHVRAGLLGGLDGGPNLSR